MSGVNKVILVGRLGKDPDVRTFETGVKRASFTLATSEIRKDASGNRVELTEWHNIICWRNLADIAEKYLTKGKLIYLEGKLRTRSWEDNGIKHFITEIETSTFTMLSNKSDSENNDPVVKQVPNHTAIPTAPAPTEEAFPDASTDNLPF